MYEEAAGALELLKTKRRLQGAMVLHKAGRKKVIVTMNGLSEGA